MLSLMLTFATAANSLKVVANAKMGVSVVAAEKLFLSLQNCLPFLFLFFNCTDEADVAVKCAFTTADTVVFTAGRRRKK